MSNKHTMSLPLRPQQLTDKRHGFVALMGADGNRVGSIDSASRRMEYEAVSRALFIATAVNVHEDLIAALKRCAFLLEISSAAVEKRGEFEFEYDGSSCDETGHRIDCQNAIDRAAAALKAAGAEP